MKWMAVYLLAGFLAAGASGNAQSVTMASHNQPLEKVFSQIKMQTGYSFVWQAGMLQKTTRISVRLNNASIEEALDACLKGQPLTYKIIDKLIVLKPQEERPLPPPIVKTPVRGIVTDENNQPLKGVSVTVKPSGAGTQTDEEGRFVIDVPANGSLLFTFVGYETKELKPGASTQLHVKMTTVQTVLEDVVLQANTGYQSIPKDRITGAFDIVTPKQIQQKAPINVLERLEGVVPGLLLINGKDNSADDALTIRGVSTLYGTKRPLIVVDNFPIEGDINSINPNDVLSITVLKDAAAASIWGAKAANGVIVITTKNGSEGKMQLTYRNSFQISSKPDLSKMHRLSAADDIWIEQQFNSINFYNLVKANPEYYTFNQVNKLYFDSVSNVITPQQYQQQMLALAGMDNAGQIKDMLMQLPTTQSHSLTVNGGNASNQYHGSLVYNSQNGHTIGDKNNNISGYFKNLFKINNRLSFNVSTNYTYTGGTRPPVNPIEVFRLKPYAMLADENGNQLPLIHSGDPNNQNTSNPNIISKRLQWGLLDENFYPVKELSRRDINFRNNYTRIQGGLDYKILKGITASISYQYESGSMVNKDFRHPDNYELAKLINDFTSPQLDGAGEYLLNADGTLNSPRFFIPKGGMISETRSDFSSYTLRGLVNVNKDLSAQSHLDAVIGVERRKQKSSENNTTRFGYDDQTLQSIPIDEMTLSNLEVPVLRKINPQYYVSGNNFKYKEDRFISAFANVAYTYKSRYVVSGSARMDPTNLFGTDPRYRYKPFWSAGASWNISREPFFQSGVIDALLLRATYGINGNIPKNSGPFMLATAGVNNFSTLPSYTITSPTNNQLSWEGTRVLNLGTDINLINHINIKFDWYKRKSTGLMSDFNINPTTGFTSVIVNAGNMLNNGFELQLTTRNISNSHFFWNTNLVFSANKNKITKVTTGSDYASAYYRASHSPNNVYVEGYPYGSLFSFRFAGLSNLGQILVLNEKGDTLAGNYYDGLMQNPDALVFSGNTRPIYTASLGNTVRYKNLELSFMFVYYGSYIMRRGLPMPSAGNVYSYNNILKNVWKQPGDEAFTSVPSLKQNPDYSSYYGMNYYRNYLSNNVFDASYLKLREVILTYDLGEKALQRLRYIKGLQLSVQGRNLWTITKNKFGYDPESHSDGMPGLPIMPTYIFGLNVNF